MSEQATTEPDLPAADATRVEAAGFYEGALRRFEEGIVMLLLLSVVLLSGAEIVVRNLGVDLFDIVPAQLATYFLSFHLGLFAAGLACRHARHISIDALSPWLSTEVKRHVTSVLFVISGLTCLWLGWLAWRYVFELLGPDVHVLADRTGFLWSERTWKMPMILSFGLMAVHFFVNARRARAGAFDEEVPS
jgi:TRAP-type C4-dicarboxylate transport system permease small subunit